MFCHKIAYRWKLNEWWIFSVLSLGPFGALLHSLIYMIIISLSKKNPIFLPGKDRGLNLVPLASKCHFQSKLILSLTNLNALVRFLGLSIKNGKNYCYSSDYYYFFFSFFRRFKKSIISLRVNFFVPKLYNIGTVCDSL